MGDKPDVLYYLSGFVLGHSSYNVEFFVDKKVGRIHDWIGLCARLIENSDL